LSESFAKRLAKLEARINALRARQSITIGLKDFAGPEPAQERVERTYRLHACPGGCGTQVRTGEARCAGCGEALAWPS
jgi:hypothetical protein